MKFWGKDNSEKGEAWRKERDKRIADAVELSPGFEVTKYECPKCASKKTVSKLYQSVRGTSVGRLPHTYHCKKCGYRGLVGLEPEKKK